MNKIPCFKHPSTILVVDDNPLFLAALKSNLGTDSDRFIFVDRPYKALEILEASPTPKNRTCLRSFPEMVYDGQRFGVITGLIADYEMPDMNGLELCEKIKAPVHRILLTGIADERVAIQAFNKKLIHCYINKSELCDAARLAPAIENGKLEYFNKITEYHQYLILHDEQERTMLDPAFIEFFWKTKSNLGAIEHFLIDPVGSFVFLNERGRATTLYTYHDGMLRYLLESVEARDVPPRHLRALACGEQVLCWHSTPEYPELPGHLWSQYMRPAIKISGQQNYYCAVVPESTGLDQARIIPFKS